MMRLINTNKLSSNQALINRQLLNVNLSIDETFKNCIEEDIIDTYKEFVLTILPDKYKNMSEEDFDWYFLDEQVINYLKNNVINQINDTLLDKTLNELIEETKSYIKITSNIKYSEIFYRNRSLSFGLLLDEGLTIDMIDEEDLEKSLEHKLYDMVNDLNNNIKEIYMKSCINSNFINLALNRFTFRHSVEEVQESLDKQIKNYNHKFDYRSLFENVLVTVNIEQLLDIRNQLKD